ncbi:hypothetical protein CHS0354_034342 [Potamilus streckersoni]|uniref:Uncharacterized protein n=1 Tax=Potamilus streckersoni TaxID=2493646 RepID=A0AAE0TKN6_9BIVA|nr:hypothetical protein CHS0354_034342 [Potamilus streckersoni]
MTHNLLLHCSSNTIQSLKMTDTDHLVEKKMKFLGFWINKEVTKDVMGKILQLIQSKKGSIVKLQLRRDGLHVLKTKIISGLILHHFIPLNNIYIITYNNKVPRVMFVVTKVNRIYQIYTFKCGNTIDAGEFTVGFRNIKRTVYPVRHEKHDGVNGTFDSMEKDAKPVLVTANAEANTKINKFNANTSSIMICTRLYDRALELSQNASHSGRECVPKKIDSIKVILEKCTGNNSNYTRRYNNEDAFDATMVLGEEEEIYSNSKTATTPQPRTENKTKPVQNGHIKDGLVRIFVPNYRNSRRKLSTAGRHVLILPTIFEEAL